MSLVPYNESASVPAHIARRAATYTNSDLTGGVGQSYPTLSFKGKVWHVVVGDTKTLITNEDGDARQSIEVVLLKSNSALSKIYYAGGYVEGSAEKPTCFSNDGVAPDRNSTEPQATKCNVCPHNQWGSRITDNGGKGKSCADLRRMAVAPAYELDHPMLVRIPADTLKELAEYARGLDRRKVPYNAVVTKVGFDNTVAHPKLTFKTVRYLTDDEYDLVDETVRGDLVAAICGLNASAAPAAAAHEEIPGAPPARLQGKPVVAEPAPEPEVQHPPEPKAKVSGFGGSEPKAAVDKPKPQTSHSDILAQAGASLDKALSMLDD
jgi:hypothetical protein